jgi:proline iminopeptidase
MDSAATPRGPRPLHTPACGVAGHAFAHLYPPLQCHGHGELEVGDGHRLHWEEAGNPLGRPALFVHGGPGAGCTPDDRRWFDPQRYRIVLFDQRGAGRSRPAGRLAANRTELLVRDMEALRRHLRIERWLLFGGSWGATLALAYAQRHAERVHALVLRGVFLATLAERRWLYADDGAALAHPAAWQRLHAAIDGGAGSDWLGALAAQLQGDDASAAKRAAAAWHGWEDALTDPGGALASRPVDDPLAMARIGVHYARHAFFLDDDALLAGASSLHGVPGVIVQGDDDLVTPPAAARALHRAWPGSHCHGVRGAGHASSHPEVARRLIAATDAFAA